MGIHAMSSWQINFKEWLFFLFAPFFVFPVFWCTVSLVDWLFGDAYVLTRFLYESKSQLAHEILSDWGSSLPVSLLSTWLLFLPLYIGTGYKVTGRVYRSIVPGVLAGLILGLWAYETDIPGLLITVLTGFVIGIFLLLWRWIIVR